MALTAGTRLGPYEIIERVGAGGMGEVYRARDPRLGREVAIKISAERFSERFAHEARAVASLNHPNICQLYDVGPDYLVMELVDGAPIAAPDGPRKLLDLAVQIADGLAAAHTAGLIHRDLKPENILVTRDGRIKVLDFGLAKSATSSDIEATRTMALTDPGTTVGTVNYMSPEQARGRPDLTPQSDQFSFGVLLYELATGRHPFQRASWPETMTAIIREDPEPLPADVHPPLRWVIERLVAKEPSERYDSTRDLYRDLRQIRDRHSQATSSIQVGAAVQTRKRSRWPLTAAIVAAALALNALALLSIAPSQPDPANYKFTPIAREEAPEDGPEWSPDGKSIAYLTNVRGKWDTVLAPLELPSASTGDMAGFSLHPDGKRFLTSILKVPYDIWMLEGFDQHQTWFDVLFRR